MTLLPEIERLGPRRVTAYDEETGEAWEYALFAVEAAWHGRVVGKTCSTSLDVLDQPQLTEMTFELLEDVLRRELAVQLN